MSEEQRMNEIYAGPKAKEQIPGSGLLFEIPVIDVPLPSNGLVYPEGNPLHGLTSITINAMAAAQENILTNRALAKRGTLLTALLQSCLTDKSIDAKSMLIGDRNTVMVALRVSGYTADYRVNVECPKCGTTNPQAFALDQLPINRLKIDPVDSGMNLFEFKLPQSGMSVHFKFLTGADEEDVAATQQARKKLGPAAATSELVTSGLMTTIVSINGITDRAELNRAIPNMPAFDSSALRKFIQNNEPGIDMKGWMDCPDCEHSQEVDMPLGASFFWPHAE